MSRHLNLNIKSMKTKTTFQLAAFLLILVIFFSTNSCKKDDDNGNGNGDPSVEDQEAYDAADGINGGKMYDKFWASETNFESPVDPGVNMADISDYGDFYRCKSCHAWDQLGTAASYIDRGPTATRPSVATKNIHAFVASSDIRTVFDAIKRTGGRPVDASLTSDGTNGQGNPHPDFSTILTDEQVWDLVKFLKANAFDVTQLYDIVTSGTYPDGSRSFTNVGKDGDASAGTAFYSSNCAGCHGENGRDDGNGNIIQINADIGRSMGEFIREKTYEIQHKAIYGALGSSPQMKGVPDASFDDIKNMLKALSDETAYPGL